MYTLYWESVQEQIESLDDVERRLDEIHAQLRNERPTLVTVELAVSRDSLSIGLGAQLSVLNYVRGDNNPPYYTSSGGVDVDEGISFLFGGELSEYPLRAAIPIEAARAAMTRFCKCGELSDSVVWEEV